MSTITAAEAANRTRRAMRLRDFFIELGWDSNRVAELDDDYWAACARTIQLRDKRPFRTPSPATRATAIELLRGHEVIKAVAAPSPRLESASAGLAQAGAPEPKPVWRPGRPLSAGYRPVNVSLMVD